MIFKHLSGFDGVAEAEIHWPKESGLNPAGVGHTNCVCLVALLRCTQMAQITQATESHQGAELSVPEAKRNPCALGL